MVEEELAVDRMSKLGSPKRRVFLIVSSICVVGALVVVTSLLIHNNVSPSSHLGTAIKNAQGSVDYSLYYPEMLPIGCNSDGQIDVQELSSIVSYQITCGTIIMNITEQPRPAEIETVKKIVTLSSSIGQEYVANLEGHLVGFLLTAQTLVIVSPNSDLEDASQLQAVLAALVQA